MFRCAIKSSGTFKDILPCAGRHRVKPKLQKFTAVHKRLADSYWTAQFICVILLLLDKGLSFFVLLMCLFCVFQLGNLIVFHVIFGTVKTRVCMLDWNSKLMHFMKSFTFPSTGWKKTKCLFTYIRQYHTIFSQKSKFFIYLFILIEVIRY